MLCQSTNLIPMIVHGKDKLRFVSEERLQPRLICYALY
jgi:hypothetical protein